MIVFILTIAASIAALIGGYTAIRAQNRLSLAMALTSGLVLGLVAFDLIPEIFEIAENENLNTVWPMITFCTGFLIFHIIEKFTVMHEASEEHYGSHHHPKLGITRAAALSGHSFLDGLSIGVGFQVSVEVGTAVAIAVIGHRFADGFDTANYMLFHKNKISHIKKLLGVVVLMPVLGGLLSLIITLSEATLAIYLGFFAGFILYIGAGNIIPQAHSKSSSKLTISLTVLGVILMLLITRISIE
jgi:zinc transporter, ZIP family